MNKTDWWLLRRLINKQIEANEKYERYDISSSERKECEIAISVLETVLFYMVSIEEKGEMYQKLIRL